MDSKAEFGTMFMGSGGGKTASTLHLGSSFVAMSTESFIGPAAGSMPISSAFTVEWPTRDTVEVEKENYDAPIALVKCSHCTTVNAIRTKADLFAWECYKCGAPLPFETEKDDGQSTDIAG